VFEILDILASGAFGTVLVATENTTGRTVALKVMHGAHVDNVKVLHRTRDEARMLQLLDHDNIVEVYDLLEFNDRPVVVMEWIQGASLEELLEKHPNGIGPGEALETIRAVSNALEAAYTTKGEDRTPMHVIHRDLKPPNILLSVEGVVKVVDFGVAKGRFEGRQAQTVSMVLGSRGYMAPERLDGADDQPSGDVYSLGLILYELLTGKRMMLSMHPVHHQAALEKALVSLRPPGTNSRVHEALRQLLMRACAYQEDERPTHGEITQAVSEILDTGGISVDLVQFARQHVVPLYKARAQVRPVDHPAYPELVFLEQEPTTAGTAPPRDSGAASQAVDDQVRRFLRRKRWENELPKLRELLQANPHWTVAPFVEVLASSDVPWWRFWGSPPPGPSRLIATLQLVTPRSNEAAREHARRLRHHPNPRVKKAARALLETKVR
jgi:serine/threonine protein kinase